MAWGPSQVISSESSGVYSVATHVSMTEELVFSTPDGLAVITSAGLGTVM